MEKKFSSDEVASFRDALLHRRLDCFQVAENINLFVARRGYGISAEAARDIASRIETAECSVECFHEQLENVTVVM